MIIIELTPEETLALRNLLDTAVRAGGMRVAEIAIALDQKILTAARAWEATQTPLQPRGNGGAEAKP